MKSNKNFIHYTTVVNTLYVISIGIVIQNIVKIFNKINITLDEGTKELIIRTINEDLDVILTFNNNNVHLITLLLIMVIFRWVLFNSYQETKIMNTRIVYIADSIQVLLFLFAFFACIKGGIIAIVAFVGYLLIRSLFDFFYAISFRKFSNKFIEKLTLDKENKLKQIYIYNKIIFKEQFTNNDFVNLLKKYVVSDIKPTIKNQIDKMNYTVVLINGLAIILCVFGSFFILYFGYISGWQLFSPDKQVEMLKQVQIPLLFVSYFVIASLGAAYIVTAKLHIKYTDLTKVLI